VTSPTIDLAVVGAALLAAYYLFRLLQTDPPSARPATMVIRLSWPEVAACAMSVTMPPAFLIVAHVEQASKPESLIALDLFASVFCLVAVRGALTAWRRVDVSDEGVSSRSPWTGTRFAPWSAIESASYSALRRRLLIRGCGFRPIRVRLDWRGAEDLVEEVRRRCPPGVLRNG